MSLTIIVPTLLRKLTEDADEITLDVDGAGLSVKQVIEQVDSRYPGFQARICEESGELRRFINIYLDGEDVRFLDNLATRAAEGAEISIVPALSGG